MPEAVLVAKDPVKVAAGLAGAVKRWSDPANRMVVRLDSLSVPQRAVVLALVDAAKKGTSAATTEVPTEVRRVSVDRHRPE